MNALAGTADVSTCFILTVGGYMGDDISPFHRRGRTRLKLSVIRDTANTKAQVALNCAVCAELISDVSFALGRFSGTSPASRETLYHGAPPGLLTFSASVCLLFTLEHSKCLAE